MQAAHVLCILDSSGHLLLLLNIGTSRESTVVSRIGIDSMLHILRPDGTTVKALIKALSGW